MNQDLFSFFRIQAASDIKEKEGTENKIQRFAEICKRQYLDNITGVVQPFFKYCEGQGKQQQSLIEICFPVILNVFNKKPRQQQTLKYPEEDECIKNTNVNISSHKKIAAVIFDFCILLPKLLLIGT